MVFPPDLPDFRLPLLQAVLQQRQARRGRIEDPLLAGAQHDGNGVLREVQRKTEDAET